MKYLKMLGLAAVAATALMAFAGAGTASADELCTEPVNAENMCPAGKRIEKLELSLKESSRLEDTSGNTIGTCTAGGVKITNINEASGNRTGTAATTGAIPAGDLTWEVGSTPCTFATTTTAGGSAEFTEASGGGTTIKATGGIEYTIAYPLGDCKYTYGASLDLGSVAQGGSTLQINVIITKSAGVLCPSSARWNAKYKITNHSAVYYINN